MKSFLENREKVMKDDRNRLKQGGLHFSRGRENRVKKS
jgi:hypothetical protein